jgi:hypothetical protein
MPPGMPEGAICVQRFDDSRNSAIHITYRISLRSSSMPEPRDPLLKVLKKVALSRSDSKNLAEFGKTLVGTGPGTRGFPGGLAAGPPKQQVKSNQGWPGERSFPFSRDGLHGLVMILPQVHLRNGFLEHTFLFKKCSRDTVYSPPYGFPKGPTIS